MEQQVTPTEQQPGFLSGGGDMARMIWDHNWSNYLPDAIENWPLALKDTLSLILRTKIPMALWWGEHRLEFCNDAFRSGFNHTEPLGQHGKEYWNKTWPEVYPAVEQVWNEGLAVCRENVLFVAAEKDSLNTYWNLNYSLVGDESAHKGVLLIVTESIAQKHRNDMDLAIHAAGLATWDLDPQTNRFVGNGRLREWFGLKENEESDLEQAIAVIIEDDRPKVLTAIAMAMIFEAGGLYDIDYTIIHPETGVLRYVRAKGKTIFDAGKQPIRFSGTLEDITNEKLTVDALEEAYEQVRLSKEAAGLGMFDMDLIKGTLVWDERCRELFGIFHSDNVNYDEDFTKGLHPDDRERVTLLIDELLKPGSDGDYDVEYRTIGAADGKLRWVRAKGKVFFRRDGKPYRFIGSVLDITESKLDEVRKNDFIGMVSHELKTPLTSLNAILQVLQMKLKHVDNFTTDALEKAVKQSKRMGTLINGFLNISRLESGKIAVYKERFDISELISEMIRENGLINTTHTVHFNANHGIIVNADREKLGSVISNLLSNAVKYSPKGSDINVSCEESGGHVVFSISDQGVGIHPQDCEKLFDRYYRVQNSQTRHISGFGIGLYLSAEIIRRHDGRIWVQSEPGKGSTFYFTLTTANS